MKLSIYHLQQTQGQPFYVAWLSYNQQDKTVRWP